MNDDNGDSLWGWQSQLQDGSWSLIAMFLATEDQGRGGIAPLRAEAGEVMVLVHRNVRVARTWRHLAMGHHDHYGQPVRFARFDLAMIADETGERHVRERT